MTWGATTLRKFTLNAMSMLTRTCSGDKFIIASGGKDSGNGQLPLDIHKCLSLHQFKCNINCIPGGNRPSVGLMNKSL